MHQDFDGTSVTWHIHEDGCRHFIPVPRIVPMVLVIALQLTCIQVQSNHRVGIEVITRMRIRRPGTSVASPPVGQVELWVVMAGDPGRTPAGLPGVAGPALMSWLAGAWNRIGFPHFLPGFGIEGRDVAANPVLAA